MLEAHGWYGDRFFDRDSALDRDPVIADVHTEPADGFGAAVGCVLHVATAKLRMDVVFELTSTSPEVAPPEDSPVQVVLPCALAWHCVA